MRLHARTALLALTAAIGFSGCTYRSSYRATSADRKTPVPGQKVRVVETREDLTTQWVELGQYQGKAPTVTEAMNAAKDYCGYHGANVFILNTPPYLKGPSYWVDGMCAFKSGGFKANGQAKVTRADNKKKKKKKKGKGKKKVTRQNG